MSLNPITLKIAAPYARALFDFSMEQNILHQVTADFQNLKIFLSESTDFKKYLNNPVISQEEKQEIISRVLKPQTNTETFKFLNILLKRDRINILEAVMERYLNLVYETAAIKVIEVSTTVALTYLQKNMLIKKLKELTNAREIRLNIIVNPSLIGGFLIKVDSKIIDFTIKNQLLEIAKLLDGTLDI